MIVDKQTMVTAKAQVSHVFINAFKGLNSVYINSCIDI